MMDSSKTGILGVLGLLLGALAILFVHSRGVQRGIESISGEEFRGLQQPTSESTSASGLATPSLASPSAEEARHDEVREAAGLGRSRLEDRLRGRVVEADSGAPIEAFRVYCLPIDSSRRLLDVEPDPSLGLVRHDRAGRFLIEDLPRGTYTVVIDPDLAGHERTIIHDVAIPRAEPLLVEVGRGAQVAGQVLDGLGRAVDGLEVVLERVGPDGLASGERSRCVTADAGRFLFCGVGRGDFRLVTANSTPDGRALFSMHEAARLERTLRLSDSGALDIAVSDLSGAPIEGARILLASPGGGRRRATTDSRGETRIAALSGDAHALRVSCEGFGSASRTVHVPRGSGDRLAITLERSAPSVR